MYSQAHHPELLLQRLQKLRQLPTGGRGRAGGCVRMAAVCPARADSIFVIGEDTAVAQLRLVALQKGQNRLHVGSDRVAAAHGLQRLKTVLKKGRDVDRARTHWGS